MNVSSRPTLDFASFVLGLRQARTLVSHTEGRFLGQLARGLTCVVEVGCFEGATSRQLLRAMSPGGVLYMVDSFELSLRLERKLGFSFSEYIARRTVSGFGNRAVLVPMRSLDAVKSLSFPRSPQMIFIDADHSYESVRADFEAWAGVLERSGVIALHDSACCAGRPELGAMAGPVILAQELTTGLHGEWEQVGSVDSTTAFRRRKDT